MRPAPIHSESGYRSPADPYYDPYWARINEAGITVLYHGGDSGYSKYLQDWGEGGQSVQSFKTSPLQSITSGTRAPFDLMAALISHKLFTRFPNLRMASIEMGSNWVPWLFQSFARSWGQGPNSFDGDPRETFRRHISISPFHEDDVPLLRDLIGADRNQVRVHCEDVGCLEDGVGVQPHRRGQTPGPLVLAAGGLVHQVFGANTRQQPGQFADLRHVVLEVDVG